MGNDLKTSEQSIVIFTDGACSGNPGPGGWGSIVALPDGSVKELGGNNKETTNNRMELAATIHALQSLVAPLDCNVIIYTDSVYVIRGITQWIFGWKSRGWKSAEGNPVANREHWEELLHQVTRIKPATISWKYVRGHSGYAGNERCDAIAVAQSKNKHEPLYSGPLDGYFVDLNDLPEDEPLPEQKKNAGSSSAPFSSSSRGGGSGGGPAKISYLSYQNGVVQRHLTWAACEKQVKGQSNTKFKKAKSAAEEIEILASWGLPATTNIRD